MIIIVISKNYSEHGFNGLIGVWVIQKEVKEQGSSKNRNKENNYKVNYIIIVENKLKIQINII